MASVVDAVLALKARVAELAALDPDRTLFGASAHRYAFQPPFTEAELSALEAAGGCSLPEDFRAFLTHVGSGGAGPSYGVIVPRGGDAEDYTKYERLGAGFAYTDDHNPVELLDPPDDADDDFDGHDAYYRAFDSTGAFYLCHHGCGSRSLLIVSGPCRGQVWHDAVAEDAGYSPALARDGTRHTFVTWYAEWLDRAFEKLRR